MDRWIIAGATYLACTVIGAGVVYPFVGGPVVTYALAYLIGTLGVIGAWAGLMSLAKTKRNARSYQNVVMAWSIVMVVMAFANMLP